MLWPPRSEVIPAEEVMEDVRFDEIIASNFGSTGIFIENLSIFEFAFYNFGPLETLMRENSVSIVMILA